MTGIEHTIDDMTGIEHTIDDMQSEDTNQTSQEDINTYQI
jgi:hypothetical protein